MNDLLRTIKADSISLVDKLPQLIYAIVILMAFIILGKLIAKGVRKGLDRGDFSKTYQAFFLKIIRWFFYLFGFLLALNSLGFTSISASILAGGGVTAVVLGFAFREIGENILAGFFLAFSRPFNIGDLIQSEDLQGRVKGVELRHTHIRTADGCDIYIPSSQIFNSPLLNYTKDGFRRAGFTIGIDYKDDIQKAIKVLSEQIKSIEDVLTDPLPTVNISGFTPNYIEIQVYFWINTFNQEISLSTLRTKAMDRCRKKLLADNFTFSSNVTTALEMDHLKVLMDDSRS